MLKAPFAMTTAAVVLIAAGAALAQGREIGSIDRGLPDARPAKMADRPAKPPTPQTEAWIASDLKAGEWRLVNKDADGVVYAKPTGAVRSDGLVAMHLRVEFREPVNLVRHDTRSILADLDVDCGSKSLNGSVNGFEGQNLSGKKLFLEPGDVTISRAGSKVETQNVRAEALRLVGSEVIRQQCAEGHRFVAAKYGAPWRPLLSDERGVRLVSGGDAVGLDRKLDLKFRIEATEAQDAAVLRWRSAVADVKVDCADGSFRADATLYSSVDEAGTSAKLAFEGAPGLTGAVRTHAVGEKPAAALTPGAAGQGGGRGGFNPASFGDTGPGKTVVDLLSSGGMVAGECEAAKAKLARALATPGDPLRRQAETWATSNLNTKGFRLPTYVPEGVLMLSDDVMTAPGDARRAVVRAEFSRPVPSRDGRPMASRITVIEVDCTTKKVRGLSETTFAKNGAKELLKETVAPQPAWVGFGDQPAMTSYFEAVCLTKPTS